ncbi:MAG: M56 family metallopeptidase [Pseudomonadota bacterium]
MNAASLIDSIGWTLLHFAWQGALIGCVTALALAVLRNASPVLRYNAACAGLLACLLWPAAELVLRLQGADMVTAQMRFADQLIVSGAAGARSGLMAWLQSQFLWIVGCWAVCAAFLAARMAMGLAWVRRTERSQTTNALWQATVSKLAIRFGVRRDVRLRVVDDLDSPITTGWWRPVVLLPASLIAGLPPELLEALLAHEMAHVKRLDYLVNLGQNVVEILLFYHPAVWWVSGRIRVEREKIADDMAARMTGDARTLARALSELERVQFSAHHLAIAANGGELVSRVKRLLRPDPQALNWKAAIPVLGLAVACLSVYAHASSRPAEKIGYRPPIAEFRTCAKPEYPADALRAEHTGAVKLGFEIGADGFVANSKVNKSSGHPELDEAARSGIARCHFKPATQNGIAVRSWTQVQYVWVLK